MKTKTIKLLEENTEKFLHDLGVGNNFLGHQKHNHDKNIYIINCTSSKDLSRHNLKS